MVLAALDTAGIARSLSQVAERDGDRVEAYFERLEEVELPPEDEAPGLRLRLEQGFALRLVRDGRVWLASRDDFGPGCLAEALRQVSRAQPRAVYPQPDLTLPPLELSDAAREVVEFPAAVRRALRDQHLAFPMRLRVRRHRRWTRVVGSRLAAEEQRESFYSVEAALPWGDVGMLLVGLDAGAASAVARALGGRFRGRDAAPPEPLRTAAVLAPAAAAVLLHEAVAHALEADTLALSGRAEAAVGLTLGSPELSVLDDPASAPEGVRRSADDEGSRVVRRWLLRDGVVEQPLADAVAADGSAVLLAGAGRRADRHHPPVPRSTHLEVLAGGRSLAELLAAAEGGIFVPEAGRGKLDPMSGAFSLRLPQARRIRGGALAERIGPCRIRGRVAEILAGVVGIGSETELAGAGWCAKGGQKLPVWATTPALLLAGIEVEA